MGSYCLYSWNIFLHTRISFCYWNEFRFRLNYPFECTKVNTTVVQYMFVRVRACMF
jgi:hypothetical protein